MIFVRRGRERRGLDRDPRAREPRARRSQPVLADDPGDSFGARDMLGDPLPVEEAGARGQLRARELRREVILVRRTVRGESLPGRQDLLGGQPADPHRLRLPREC